MNKKNSDWLHKNFPKLYVHHEKGKVIRRIGFECGDGWFSVIKGLSIAIQNHLDHNHEEVEKAVEWNAMIARGEKPDWWAVEKLGNPAAKKVPKKVEQVQVTQVKEKFGSLRFYHSGGDLATENFVFLAEVMSSIVCEKCGKAGERINGNWIVTLCSTCAKKNKLLFNDQQAALANLKDSIIHNTTEAV